MALEIKDKTNNQNDFVTNSGVSEVTDAPSALTGAVYSAEVNGTDYLEALDSSSLDITSDITIELWCKTTNTSGAFGLNKFVEAGNQRSWSTYGDSFEGVQWINSDDGDSGFGDKRTANSKVIVDGTWHHYAVVFTASAQAIKVYVDGTEVTGGYSGATALPTSIFNSTAPVKLSHAAGADPAIRVCDIRIWSTARSAGEVSGNYTTLLTGTESGLVANWQFQPFERPVGGYFFMSY